MPEMHTTLLVSNVQYQNNFTQLTQVWNPLTADYLITNWLPLKHKFVAYLTDQHPHFSNCNSLRIESLHSYIKSFINSSAGAFSIVVKQLFQAISIQIHEEMTLSSQQDVQHLIGLPPSLKSLTGKISHYALKMSHSAWKLRGNTNDCVDCHYLTKWGMPCLHKIRDYEAKGNHFEVEDFHPQWHVKSFLVRTLIFSCVS